MAKVYYLSGSKIPSRTANSVHVMKMCSAMASIGHDVTLFAQKGDNTQGDIFASYAVKKRFKIIFFRAPRIPMVGGALLGFFVALRILWMGRPDYIYGRHIYSTFFSSALRVPFFFESHAIHEKTFVRCLKRLIVKRNNLIKFVVISEALKFDYLQLFPQIQNQDIFVAHDAADEVPNLPEGTGDAGKGRIKVGYIGHLYEGKGMEIVSRLPKLRPDMEFHVVGGNDSDIARWSDNLADSNLVFHGYVQQDRLSEYYRMMDIFLLPLQKSVKLEGGQGDIARWTSPLKAFEYMSYGKPIISSDIPVLKEIFQHEYNALVARSDVVEDWVFELTRLRDCPDLGKRLGEKALQKFYQSHTWSKRAETIFSSV